LQISPDATEPPVKALRVISDYAIHLHQLLVVVTEDGGFGCELEKQAGRSRKGFYVALVIRGPEGREPRELFSLAARPTQERPLVTSLCFFPGDPFQ
jgi:hypothetical protein